MGGKNRFEYPEQSTAFEDCLECRAAKPCRAVATTLKNLLALGNY